MYLKDIENPGQGMPPVSQFLPKEDGDDSDEEDFEMGGVSQDYNCPITLKPLLDPVTSYVLSHSY